MRSTPDLIRISGLREFQASLRRMDAGAPRQLRLVHNEAAGVVVTAAQPRIPTRSGRARASVRARSTQRATRVRAGGARAPYYPWLDYGGAVGRRNSVRRPFVKDGRYLYPSYRENRQEVQRVLEGGVVRLAHSTGLKVK